MKIYIKIIALALVALTIVACEPNQDDNVALEYETLEVNFSVKTSGFDMPENSTYGIAAYCARNDQDGVQMNETKKISVYNSISEGTSSNLIKASDSDLIKAFANDRNFNFYAVYPYNADVDFNAVEAVVPAIQEYDNGVNSYMSFTAHTRVTSIVPTAELEMTTPFSVLNLSVPIDIIEEGVPSILKSITIIPADTEKFSGALAGEGTINAETGDFTITPTSSSNSIKLDFPDEGLTLKEANTIIPVAVLPFTVPEGGFEIGFEGKNGKSNSTFFLNQTSDAGAAIEASTVTDITISRAADGVVPVIFPVEFLIGRVDDVRRFTTELQPKWVPDSIWTCPEQTQAYATWHKVSDPSDAYFQYLETVNSGDISSPGVKGIWTGDYLEFTIPVKNFEANTQIKMEFPFYGRAQPVFWNIKYLDGETWKTVDLTEKFSADNTESMECTFVLGYDVITICSFVMPFENEIKSGYLKFRLECAEGSIQSASGNTVVIRDTPFVGGSGYGAPCYFRSDRGTTIQAISFTIQ